MSLRTRTFFNAVILSMPVLHVELPSPKKNGRIRKIFGHPEEGNSIAVLRQLLHHSAAYAYLEVLNLAPDLPSERLAL